MADSRACEHSLLVDVRLWQTAASGLKLTVALGGRAARVCIVRAHLPMIAAPLALRLLCRGLRPAGTFRHHFVGAPLDLALPGTAGAVQGRIGIPRPGGDLRSEAGLRSTAPGRAIAERRRAGDVDASDFFVARPLLRLQWRLECGETRGRRTGRQVRMSRGCAGGLQRRGAKAPDGFLSILWLVARGGRWNGLSGGHRL